MAQRRLPRPGDGERQRVTLGYALVVDREARSAVVIRYVAPALAVRDRCAVRRAAEIDVQPLGVLVDRILRRHHGYRPARAAAAEAQRPGLRREVPAAGRVGCGRIADVVAELRRSRLRHRERQRAAFRNTVVVDREARRTVVVRDVAVAAAVADRRAIRGIAEIDVQPLGVLVERVLRRRHGDRPARAAAPEAQRPGLRREVTAAGRVGCGRIADVVAELGRARLGDGKAQRAALRHAPVVDREARRTVVVVDIAIA